MEALGTAVGVASFGIQVCQGLLSYYDGWKGYPTDISRAYQSIADLAQTFTILKAGLIESKKDDKSKESRAKVETCIKSCTKGLYRLQERLSKLRSRSEPRGLQQKTWAEVQRALYPFRMTTISKLKGDVAELRNSLSLALQTLHQISLDQGFDQTANTMSALLSNQQVMEDEISELLSGQQVAKYEAIVKWLSPLDHQYNHSAARQKHAPETGNWLLDSPEYDDWKKASTNTVLWLTGKAGCGKTILCSTVVEDIRALPNTRLAFFYFSFSDVGKQSYVSLLTSFIVQLAKKGELVFKKLQQLYDEVYPSKPSASMLEDMLSACLHQPEQTVLAIDAIDELPENDKVDGRPAVLNWLGRIMQSSSCPIKIFVTSRQLSDIQALLTSLDARCVLLRADIANKDIQKYVTTELDNDPQLIKFDANTKQQIIELFEQKADGMFRWAFCQLEVLKGLKSTKPKHVKTALRNLPDTLDETYERMLLDIDKILWDEALLALRWLAFETRPLTLSELNEACLIDCDTGLVDVDNRGQADELLGILAGLIVVEDSHEDCINATGDVGRPYVQPIDTRSRVRLAHFSVKEYLLSSRILNSKAHKFALREGSDFSILAQSCLAYVLYCSPNMSKTRKDLLTFPLLQYAAQAWTEYARKHDQAEPGYQIELLESEQHRRNWLDVYQPDRRGKEPFEGTAPVGSALYYASCIGVVRTCQVLLSRGADVITQGGYYSNALEAASARGHQQVIQLLLDAGADVNAGDALWAAWNAGHQQVVQQLLDAGVDINASETFHHASTEGDQQVVQLLLDAGADVNATDALQAASGAGHLQVVQLLLDAGADVNTQEGRYGHALWAASGGGHQQVVQQLLDAGADVKASGALVAASGDGYPQVIQLLLDAGADVDANDALWAASGKGQQQVIQQLLDAGADVNVSGALWAASVRGHQKVVQVLLDAGADVNASDALQLASAEGYQKVVQQLLDAGADVNAGGALVAASAEGRLEVVQLLLDAGADVDAQVGLGNALQAASASGHQQVVQLLLDHGADVNTQGGRYGNALQAASAGGHQQVVQLLLDAGANV